MQKTEIRMTGSGGQGVIMGTIILAEAAFDEGKQVVQCQAYGPEARGGSSKAETIISDSKISYTKVLKPDLLLSLTQQSLDKYVTDLKPDSVIIADSSLSVPEEIMREHKVYSIPILESAKKIIKNRMTANIISCGAINAVAGICSKEALKRAVLERVPKESADSNLDALALGAKLIDDCN